MKMSNLILGQLFFCLSIGCYAQSYTLNVERFKATDNFVVQINNPAASKLTFHVKSKDGKPLLQESFMFVEKIRKVVFLGSLSPGEYLIETSNGEETKSETVTVEGVDKTVHPENGKGLVVGFSKLKADNTIDIIIQNKLEKNVLLRVYKEKALLSTEELGDGSDIIKKILKMGTSQKGDFIVKVGTKETVYQYKLTL